MPTVAINDIDLNYSVVGSGVPLLLVPGLGMHSGQWGALPKMFPDGIQVIMIDPRGTGKSQRGSQVMTLPLLAADVLALLEYLSIDRVNLCGASFGGVLSQYIAVHYPEKIDRLILVATHGEETVRFKSVCRLFRILLKRLTPEEFSQAMMPLLFSHTFMKKNDKTLRAYEKAFLPSPEQMAVSLEQLDASAELDWMNRVHEIQTPCLLLAGDEDVLTPLEDMEELHVSLAHARMIVFPGVGHSPFAETPRDCVQAIAEFLCT